MPDTNTTLQPQHDAEAITFSAQQLERLHYLQLVAGGYLSLREASEKIGVSYRQAKRLKKSFGERGIKAVQHGNIGRRSSLAVGNHLRIRILHLARTRYASLSANKLTKILADDHHIVLSRETVRLILRSENILRPAASGHSMARRPAYGTREGMMVLWGSSAVKSWFGAGQCCFMAAVDVATLQCLAGRFFPEESPDGYFFLLREMVRTRGVPQSVCQHPRTVDRLCHRAFERQERAEALEEMLKTLGIKCCCERSSKLIGISALFQTYLAEQIESRSIPNLEKANLLLDHGLLAGFNNQYACQPLHPEPAWRILPKHMQSTLFGGMPAEAAPLIRCAVRKKAPFDPVIPCR